MKVYKGFLGVLFLLAGLPAAFGAISIQSQTSSTETSGHAQTMNSTAKKKKNKVGHDMEKSGSKTGKAVAKSSKSVAKSSKSVAKDTGEVAGAGAKTVGKGAKKTAEAPVKLARKVGHSTKPKSSSKSQ